jgi:hypothetical protein
MAGNNPRGRGPQKDKVVVSLDAKAVHDAIPGIVALVKAAGNFIEAAGPTNNRLAPSLDAHMSDLRIAHAAVVANMEQADV